MPKHSPDRRKNGSRQARSPRAVLQRQMSSLAEWTLRVLIVAAGAVVAALPGRPALAGAATAVPGPAAQCSAVAGGETASSAPAQRDRRAAGRAAGAGRVGGRGGVAAAVNRQRNHRFGRTGVRRTRRAPRLADRPTLEPAQSDADHPGRPGRPATGGQQSGHRRIRPEQSGRDRLDRADPRPGPRADLLLPQGRAVVPAVAADLGGQRFRPTHRGSDRSRCGQRWASTCGPRPPSPRWTPS